MVTRLIPNIICDVQIITMFWERVNMIEYCYGVERTANLKIAVHLSHLCAM